MQSIKQLPLRPVARILIVKDGKICLAQVRDDHGKLVCYNFPGGGVDNGDNHEETCRKEALEEVGIIVKNIRPIGLEVPAEHPMGKKREHLYRGTNNIYFTGEYVGEDKTHLNSEGDEMKFTWEIPSKAIRLIKTGPPDAFNDVRIAAIEAYIKLGKTAPVTRVW